MTTPHPEDMPEAIEAYEDRYQCSAEDPMCQADLGFFLAGWSASASLAEQRTRSMREAQLSKAQIDAIVYQCRQAGDDTTYAVVNAAIRASLSTPPSAPGKGEAEGKDAKDAARYRWLARKVSAHGVIDGWAFGFPTHLTLPAPASALRDPEAALGEAIDAAMNPGPLERMQKIDEELGEEP